MTLAMTRRARTAVVALLTLLVLSTTAAFHAGAADAYLESWGSKYLPGHTWTGSGNYAEGLYFESAKFEGGTGTQICVAPATKSGSGWAFPYGWECSSSSDLVTWEWPAITGMPAVDNPTSGWYEFGALAGFS